MPLHRTLQSARTVVPPELGSRQAASVEERPWSRRKWPREQLRAHWPHLTIQQVELLKEVFQLFDTEDKGYFTKDDLFFVMEAMGGSPTPQELDAVMYELDSNGDAVVDFPEFLTKFLTATDEKELLSVFHQLAIQEGEGNDDRVLTLTAVERSFQYVGERLTDEDKKYLEIIFRGADKDGNGRLDIKEFTAYLEKMDDELFMGQAGALGNLLAVANISGGAKGLCSTRQGGSAGAGASQRRSNGEDAGDGGDGAGGSGIIGTDAGVGMLTNSQILAMATRALSGRIGGGGFGGSGLQDDVESVTSQGPLRNSFLSKLRRRRRRFSVNSSTIAAIAGQLASLGVASSGHPVRAGSMSSAACLAAASLLQQEASDGLRSVSSARMVMHPHLGGHPGPAPGPVGPPHFLVEASSVSAMRSVSSTGQIGAYLYPEDQSPRVMPATAPVALSRGGSFCDNGAAANGIGTDGVAAAVSGLPHHQHHQHHHMQQHPVRGPASAGGLAAGSGGVPNGTNSSGIVDMSAYSGHPLQNYYSNGFQVSHPHMNQHQPPPNFHPMRSHSMSAAIAMAATAALTPLAIPASLRDPDESLSGSVSSYHGGSVSSTMVSPAAERQVGVHVGYTGRPTGGMRSPAATWQKASVIQEAPDEGDSACGGGVVPATQHQQRLEHRMDPPVRTSAPSRFGRLASFPARMPQQLEVPSASGAGMVDSVGDGAAMYPDSRNSAGNIRFPPRPIRLGSGGDNRLGSRIGGLMAAVFSRQRSLGPAASIIAAQTGATPNSPLGRGQDFASMPSVSHLQVTIPQTSGEHADDDSERRTGSSGSWGLAAGARTAMRWLRRASSLGNNRSTTGSGVEGVGVGGAGRLGRIWLPSPLPETEAVTTDSNFTTAAGSLAPPWRLTVEVPGSYSPGSSTVVSPAEPGACSGPVSSVGASSLISPLSPTGTSPLISPANGVLPSTATSSGGGSGGLVSPPAALLAGPTVAAVASAMLGQSESGLVHLSSTRLLPSAASQNRPPPISSSRPGWRAQTYLRPPALQQIRSSAPGASPPPRLHQLVHQHPQSVHHTLTGPHQVEPVTAPLARPAPQMPGSVMARGPAPPLGVGPVRSLHRSGSAGGSSRLAVSSARDSPPVVSPHVQRQQSLQPFNQQQQQQYHYHHPPLPPPPPHRLNQQGLPQHSPYALHTSARGAQSPYESEQPHRLSHTGLPRGAGHCRHQQQPQADNPPTGPPAMQRELSLQRGDGDVQSPAGLPCLMQQMQVQPGTGSVSPGEGVPPSPRGLQFPSTASAAAAAAAGAASGSPWAAVWASAQSLQGVSSPGRNAAGISEGGLCDWPSQSHGSGTAYGGRPPRSPQHASSWVVWGGPSEPSGEAPPSSERSNAERRQHSRRHQDMHSQEEEQEATVQEQQQHHHQHRQGGSVGLQLQHQWQRLQEDRRQELQRRALEQRGELDEEVVEAVEEQGDDDKELLRKASPGRQDRSPSPSPVEHHRRDEGHSMRGQLRSGLTSRGGI